MKRLLGRNAAPAEQVEKPMPAAPVVPPAAPAARKPAPPRRPPAALKLRGLEDARGAIYALILAGTDAARRPAGLKFVAEQESLPIAGHTKNLFKIAAQLAPAERLPYIDSCFTRLRTMPPEASDKFLRIVRVLIDADQRYTLPEFTLNILLQSRLGRSAPAGATAKLSRQEVIPEMRLLLSLMARAGTDDGDEAARNLSRLMFQLTGKPAEIAPASELNINGLTAALDRMRQAPAMVRETIVQTLAECVTLDGKVKPMEGELLAAIAARLGLPVPALDFSKLSRMES
ncbi:MAG: hypothetical protein HYR49_09440 [Gammaproteobacteria bacterium]|nr:hypothetical protein [Gammaproteobacteria bacterium]